MASDRAKRQMAAWKRQGRAEEIDYRPGGMPAEGEDDNARTIDAVVDRTSPEDVMSARAPGMRVTVLNDADDGIATAGDEQIDRGADLLEIAELVGGEPVARGIQRIIKQDADFVTLEVM